MLITIKEYAEKHGKARSTVNQMCLRGNFQTALKIGRDWVIDSEEPYPDNRIKSGKYIGQKKLAENTKDGRIKSGKYVGWRTKYKRDK